MAELMKVRKMSSGSKTEDFLPKGPGEIILGRKSENWVELGTNTNTIRILETQEREKVVL